MKTLFILHYPPPIHGAALVGQCIKESQVINNRLDARYINLSTSVAVNEIGKGGFKKWFRYARILGLTYWQGLFWRPNLVYITLSSHGAGLIKDSMVVLICRLLSLRHVYHFHNKGVERYAQTKIGKSLYPFIFKKAEVILLSPLLYQDIAAYVPEDRVHYCANGIPAIKAREESKPGNKSTPLQLLFLSNLIASKGVWKVLETCQLLQQENVNFQCTLAGGEGDISTQEVQDFIHEHSLSDKVSYIGKVHGVKKQAIFEKANVFLHPTKEDCFPLVLLEAMQYALPIISTAEGAIPEIVTDKKEGFIVEKDNAKVIAECVNYYLAHDNVRIKHGNTGKNKYEELYTTKAFEDRFIKIMENIHNKTGL